MCTGSGGGTIGFVKQSGFGRTVPGGRIIGHATGGALRKLSRTIVTMNLYISNA